MKHHSALERKRPCFASVVIHPRLKKSIQAS